MKMNVSLQRVSQLALATAAVGAFMATAIPEADAARRASLAQNRLILDTNDVYLFPQVAVEYTNHVRFDYGGVTGSGSGLALLGDDSMAFGIGVFRGDLLDPDFYPYNLGHPNLGNIGNPLGGPYEAPHTIIDLFGAFDLGGGLAGARLSVGNGGNRQVDIFDDTDSNSQTFVAANLGYSLLGDMRIDTGLRLQFATGSIVAGDDDQNSGSAFLLGLTLRGFSPLSETVDLGFLADLAFSTGSSTLFGDPDLDIDDVTERTSAILAGLGAGPAYDIDGVTTIAGYGVLGFQRFTDDPDISEDDNRSFVSSVIVPGVHIAADIQLLEWLYFRSGMQYNFQINTNTQEQDIDGIDDAVRDTTAQSNRDSNFGWRAGVGIQVDNFTLDGAFQTGFILNGPDFLGGAGGGMFTMVTAGYTF